jgi:L-threonylcarbamoyladenylate synthase
VTAPVRTASPITITAAADILRRGGLVITPTATNYNLICDATNQDAVERVFRVKRRVKLGPLPVSLPYPRDIPTYVEVPDNFDLAILDEALPGEVSFIFRQRYPFCDQLSCGLRTVAVSCTSDPVFRGVVKAVGGPVAATSANLSGQGNIYVTLQKALDDLGDDVDLIIDAGPTAAAAYPDHPDRVNTIVDLTFDHPWLCRPGWVPLTTLTKYFPDLQTDVDTYRQLLAERVSQGGMIND